MDDMADAEFQTVNHVIKSLEATEKEILSLLDSAADAVDALAAIESSSAQQKFEMHSESFLSDLAEIQRSLREKIKKVGPRIPMANTNLQSLVYSNLALQQTSRAHEHLRYIVERHRDFVPKEGELEALGVIGQFGDDYDAVKKRAELEKAEHASRGTANDGITGSPEVSYEPGTVKIEPVAGYEGASLSVNADGVQIKAEQGTVMDANVDDVDRQREGSVPEAAGASAAAAVAAALGGETGGFVNEPGEQVPGSDQARKNELDDPNNILGGMDDVDFDFGGGEMDLDF